MITTQSGTIINTDNMTSAEIMRETAFGKIEGIRMSECDTEWVTVYDMKKTINKIITWDCKVKNQLLKELSEKLEKTIEVNK